jgi:hypothetical protein
VKGVKAWPPAAAMAEGKGYAASPTPSKSTSSEHAGPSHSVEATIPSVRPCGKTVPPTSSESDRKLAEAPGALNHQRLSE